MNTERLKHKGLLAEAKEKRDTLLLELRMLRDSIRESLDPFVELLDIDTHETRILFLRFEERLKELRSSQELIDRLEAELYG